MKILIDVNHPAHVHFFRNPAKIMQDNGHQVIFTSRAKDVTLDLMREYNLANISLSSASEKGGAISLMKELASRNLALYKIAKKEKPDIMTAIGGTFIAHVGYISRTPSIVFYDTENAKLQNLITYPLASCVVVPQCYQSWLPKQHVRYGGYHELAYLHPKYFEPKLDIAIKSGLDPERENIFIRLVSWKANHDIGEKGWTHELLDTILQRYGVRYNIIISSEAPLNQRFSKFLYQGRVSDIHHLMAFCKLFVGESATMASECAILGTPAIYAANTGRGYTDEQEKKYNLVKNVRALNDELLIEAIDFMLRMSRSEATLKRQQLLSEKIDVAEFASTFITHWKNHEAKI